MLRLNYTIVLTPVVTKKKAVFLPYLLKRKYYLDITMWCALFCYSLCPNMNLMYLDKFEQLILGPSGYFLECRRYGKSMIGKPTRRRKDVDMIIRDPCTNVVKHLGSHCVFSKP
jgi:hypothetical protein